MVLFIIAAVILLASIGVGVKFMYDFFKNPMPLPFKETLKRIGIVSGVFVISFLTMMLSIYLWTNYKPNGLELTAAITGGLLVPILGLTSLFTFIFHYYGTPKNRGIDENVDKWLFRILMIAFPLFIASLFWITEGYASSKLIHYPLVNGLSFTHGFVNPEQGYNDGIRPNLAFYALCILSGAMYAYFLGDHKLYLQYGKHGIGETLFLLALPSGIAGARLFYVIGNWKEFANQSNPFLAAINITDGGLTILGGAIVGIAVGMLWFRFKMKQYNFWLCVDIMAPLILIGQACGRWGNFFNCEVHGFEMSAKYWQFLPTFIKNNIAFSCEAGFADPGNIFVPLFLIESVTNMLGYFVLAHVFGNALRKHTAYGDIAFGYIVWYGLTRLFMEPLRYAAFNMGDHNYWSWIWAICFVVLGSLAIGLNHLIRTIKHPRKPKMVLHLVGTIAVGVLSLACIIPGIILMANNTFSSILVYNAFNWGILLTVIGVALLLGLMITIPPLFINKKETVNAEV